MKKIVIWGMGRSSSNFLQTLDSTQNEVIAFTQTAVSDELREFRGVQVVKPVNIPELVFDYIVICSAFYDDILLEIQKLNIDPTKIIPDARMGCISKWSQRDEIVKVKGKKIIGKNTNVFTIGSCFE